MNKQIELKKARGVTALLIANLISDITGCDPSDNLMSEKMEDWDRMITDPDLDNAFIEDWHLS